MQLLKIDKPRYRKHLNIIIVLSIIGLSALSLSISQTLIALFPSAEGTHFHWNFTGVACATVLIGLFIRKYKQHSFMTEVMYVWNLKQALNQITRKLKKVKNAVAQGDVSAMHALHFYYCGNRQLWQLDDNMITMDELAIWQAELDVQAKQYNVTLDIALYDPLILKSL